MFNCGERSGEKIKRDGMSGLKAFHSLSLCLPFFFKKKKRKEERKKEKRERKKVKEKRIGKVEV